MPKSLIHTPREMVTSLLGRTSHQSRFRLDAIAAELFEPLAEFLGQKRYFFSDDHASSLDCLAIGYLSLALVPRLSYPWLREALQTKNPSLEAYTERLRLQCFGVVEVSDAFSEAHPQPGSILPWQAPVRVTLGGIGATLLDNMADSTPILKEVRANNRVRQAAASPDSGLDASERQHVAEVARARSRDMYVSIATVVAGVAAFVGYL